MENCEFREIELPSKVFIAGCNWNVLHGSLYESCFVWQLWEWMFKGVVGRGLIGYYILQPYAFFY